MNNKRWTLNADVGEGCDDSLIMPYIDCANVCCGAHAGSLDISEKTIRLAEHHQVAVGAHPGYPDRENFGRLSLKLNASQLQKTLYQQITDIQTLANNLVYVKPHGALNHDMLVDDALFERICQVVHSIDPALALMVPTNPNHKQQTAIAQQYRLSIYWEVFADRAYEANGLLRPRKYPDAVHQKPTDIINQITQIKTRQSIIAIDGSVIDVAMAQTICVHGDNPASIAAIRQLG